MTDEKELIIGLKAGNKECYRKLFRLYYAPFVRFVQKIIDDRTIAEDIVQEAFTKIFLTRDKLDESKSLQNLLYVLCKNMSLNHLRSLRKKTIIEISTGAISNMTSDSLTISNELRKAIKDSISTMPEKRRTVFKLSRESDLSNKEIAQNLNIAEKTVERHITMALAKIRKDIKNN